VKIRAASISENSFKSRQLQDQTSGLGFVSCRELPNPLLTYQLYNRFASAMSEYEGEERLLKVHDVIQQLPPPHYRYWSEESVTWQVRVRGLEVDDRG